MHVLLLYDISDDNKRAKVADACLDYGLDRLQYSAFYGELIATHQEELILKIKKVLGKKAGRVHLIPVSRREWRAKMVIEQDG